MGSTISSSKSSEIINTLHSLLKPFLLRRLKVDVEQSLPPKKEYVLYAPLTERQRSVYSAVVEGGLRRFLIDGKQKAEQERMEQQTQNKENEYMMSEGRKLRKRGKRANYDLDGDDDEYFDKLESGDLDGDKPPERETADLAREYQYRSAGMCGLLETVVPQHDANASHSEASQWPEIAKHRNATSQGLLTSFPI